MPTIERWCTQGARPVVSLGGLGGDSPVQLLYIGASLLPWGPYYFNKLLDAHRICQGPTILCLKFYGLATRKKIGCAPTIIRARNRVRCCWTCKLVGMLQVWVKISWWMAITRILHLALLLLVGKRGQPLALDQYPHIDRGLLVLAKLLLLHAGSLYLRNCGWCCYCYL